MTTDYGVLAIGRTPTIAGWIVIGTALAALVVLALVSRGRFPDGVALLRAAMQHAAVRAFVLIGWVWLGWHFFVRTTR